MSQRHRKVRGLTARSSAPRHVTDRIPVRRVLDLVSEFQGVTLRPVGVVTRQTECTNSGLIHR
jgi:hypothetical protein